MVHIWERKAVKKLGVWLILVKSMQYLILFFAFTHAANGIRMIVEDYIGHTFWQPFVRALIAMVWMGMVIIGIYVILGSAY